VMSVGFVAQVQNWGIPSAFLAMLPYLATIALMGLSVLLRGRAQRRISTGPAALGTPYIREGA
jgi:ABC-type uncharacterized transport system permease subunit